MGNARSFDSGRKQSTLIQMAHVFSILRCSHIRGDKGDGLAKLLIQLTEQGQDLLGGTSIHIPCRFISKDDRWISDNRTNDRYALLCMSWVGRR